MSDYGEDDEPSKFNGWKIASFVLIAVLVSACFVGLYFVSSQNVVSASPNFIEVSIEGSKKLGVNETGVYLANVVGDGEYEFVWSISPVDNKTLLVPNGVECSLTFVDATEEPYMLSVQVEDLNVGNLGSASTVVYDPFTVSNVYLGNTVSPYNVILDADKLGWYRAVNGTTGAELINSTDGMTVLQYAVTNLPSWSNGGGSIYIKAPYDASGELTIDRGKVSIVTDRYQGASDYNVGEDVFIQNIKLDATSANVYLVRLQGFLTRQIYFNVPSISYSIGNSVIEDVVVAPKAGSGNGLIFWKAVSGSIDQIHFNRVNFNVKYAQDTGYGVINWLNSGCGGLFFSNCNLESTYNGVKTFMLLNALAASGGGFGDVQVQGLHVYNTANNLTMVKVLNQTASGWVGDVYGLNFVGGYWENHAYLNLVEIEASSRPEHHNTLFNGVTFFNGGYLTLINNLNTNWQTDWNSGIIFDSSIAAGTISQIYNGTFSEGANFSVTGDIFNLW